MKIKFFDKSDIINIFNIVNNIGATIISILTKCNILIKLDIENTIIIINIIIINVIIIMLKTRLIYFY